MDFSIAGILALDGLTNGAVYALLALAIVLVFAVTRVIFIPQGEFVAFGALTLALLQLGKVPGTIWLLLALAALVAPVLVAALTWWAAPLKLHLLVQSALTLAIVTLLGPLVYRLAYQRLADATVLVL